MANLFVDPTMRLFATCAAILVGKMLLTGYATSLLRWRTGYFVTAEDYAYLGRTPPPPEERVERVRRAHRNDLEEVLPFLAVGFLFALTGPSYDVAWWLFVPFTVARVLHTIAYAAGIQPWRSIVFAVGDVALLATTALLLARVVRG